MEITLSKVFERDIDLFFIDELITNQEFKNFFLQKINIEDAEIISIRHSLFDTNLGETDITLIIKDVNNLKYGVLIEDKIDAIAMSNQSGRYFERGDKGIQKGEYIDYKVCILAPKDYLNHNKEAIKYDNKISYEDLLEFLINNNSSQLKITLFQEALNKKKIGYQAIENTNVTDFWQKYYEFQEINYPRLKLNKVKGPRGSNAAWPIFFTNLKNVTIIHKSNVGYADLTFGGYGEKTGTLNDLIGDFLDKDMYIVKTNKSAAVRVNVPIIDFKKSFNNYKKEIKIIFNTIEKLSKITDKIDYISLYKN